MKNFKLFIMGFTIPEIKTPVPPNAGSEMKSCVGMFNFIIWGVGLLKTIQKISIGSGHEFPYIFNRKGGN